MDSNSSKTETGDLRRPLWPGLADATEDFGGLRIPKRLLDAFGARGIVAASGIQTAVMSRLSEGENVIVHAPTGGGKTLAFLLPMLARLQPTMHVGMQALILVPTPELALQITQELRWLFDVLCGPERVLWFNPQVTRELACTVLLSRKGLWDAIRQDTAVLISTPGLILSELVALRRQAKKFEETLAYFMCSNIGCIILDEVDVMFPALSASKNPKKAVEGATQRVMEFMFDVLRQRYRNRDVQLVCASATANSNRVQVTLERMLQRKWTKRRDVGRRRPPTLIQHGARMDQLPVPAKLPERAGEAQVLAASIIVPPSITHALAVMAGKGKADRFQQGRLEMVCGICARLEGTVLVFVPETVKLDAMVLALREAGLTEACKYRSAMGLGQDVEQLADERLEYMRQTRQKKSSPPMDSLAPEAALARAKELSEGLARGERRILVFKADAVRGVDLADVRYVVMLRLPAMSTEYLHLAGRTGRMGRRGTVITVVSPQEHATVCPRVEARLGFRFERWDAEAGEVVAWPSEPPAAEREAVAEAWATPAEALS